MSVTRQSTVVIKVVVVYIDIIHISRLLKEETAWATAKSFVI